MGTPLSAKQIVEALKAQRRQLDIAIEALETYSNIPKGDADKIDPPERRVMHRGAGSKIMDFFSGHSSGAPVSVKKLSRTTKIPWKSVSNALIYLRQQGKVHSPARGKWALVPQKEHQA